MNNQYYIGCITTWELAYYISRKLNAITKRKCNIVDGKIIPYPEITPDNILAQNPSRKDLIFYYEKICLNAE